MAYASPSLQSSGYTFANLVAGGLDGLLEKLIAANLNANGTPTAPTLSATGSGNTLPSATYYVQVTETNGVGESLPSATTSGQAVTLGQALVVTFATLKTHNTARNVYVATSSSGPFVLVATGQTGSSYSVTAPLPTNSLASATPPTADSTGLVSGGLPTKMRACRSAESGNLQDVYRNLKAAVRNFSSAKPTAFQDTIRAVRDAHVAIALLNQACVEIGTLIDANPGSVKPSQLPSGVTGSARVWP